MRGKWSLAMPHGFDPYAPVRGVLLGTHLERDGRQFPAIGYDPYRIIQDASHHPPFYEPNVILVPDVTKEAINRAVEWLAEDGHVDWLLELGPVPESAWSLVVPESTDWAETITLDGWLAYGDRRFPVTICDLEGLATTVGWDGLDHFDRFGHIEEKPQVVAYTQNLVVIPELTREAAEQAVDHLGRHEFKWLLESGS